MRITNPNLLIDIVCDVYEKLHNVTVMREISDAEIVKLFDDDTSAPESNK